MMKKVISAALAASLVLSLGSGALALRVSDTEPKAAMGTVTTTKVSPYSHGDVTSRVTFSDLENRIRSGNTTVKALEENLKMVKAMDFDQAIDDLEDTIKDLQDTVSTLEIQGSSMVSGATAAMKQVSTAIAMAEDPLTKMKDLVVDGTLTGAISGVSTAQTMSAYLSTQKSSLEGTIESLQESIDDLAKQKKEYGKTIEDTERQIENAIRQMITGAESLYITILTTELQKEGLEKTRTALDRTVEEMELRNKLGQISDLTLKQVKQGCETLDSSMVALDNGIASMKSSLQSLMGETPTGLISLQSIDELTGNLEISAYYTSDLERAKRNSYDIYKAGRTKEDAEDDMKDQKKEYGTGGYQYQMALHSYEAAVKQEAAAISSFELNFQNLYNALAPKKTALETAEKELAYQKDVYAANELKYKQGNLSLHALADAKDALDSAQRDVTSAKADLFSALNSYQNAVDYGIASSSGGSSN